MSGPEDIEARVVRLEHEVARLQERLAGTGNGAAAARVPAGGADRDGFAEMRSGMAQIVTLLGGAPPA